MKQYGLVIIIAIVLVVLVIAFNVSFFIVEEGQQAITIRFGKIENVHTTAGLKFKLVIDEVHVFPKKILSWDGNAQRIPTEQSEAQFILVDTTARWMITDLKRFYESLGTRGEALKKLDDIVDSSIRTVISRNLLLEAVRYTKTPLEFTIKDLKNPQSFAGRLLNAVDPVSLYMLGKFDVNKKAILRKISFSSTVNKDDEEMIVSMFNTLLADKDLYDEKRFSGIYLIENARVIIAKPVKTDDEMKILNRMLIEAAYPQDIMVSPVKKGREALSEEMLALSRSKIYETDKDGNFVLGKDEKPIHKFGIEIIDIIMRQIKYSDDLTESVNNRMIQERNQMASKTRSEGIGEKDNILGKLTNDVKRIESEAFKKAEEMKGKADADATAIYAQAYQQDPDFFKFWRTIESYKATLPTFKKTLSTDADYFDYLYNQRGY